jgi:uncharacterized protein
MKSHGYLLFALYLASPTVCVADETKDFVAVVLAETEDVWNGIFAAKGSKYEEPTLVLFSGDIVSACGSVSASTGPSYCPDDRKIYLDPAYFEQLERIGVSGDFAEAFLISREVGRHVQNLTGILPKFNQQRQKLNEVEANQLSVRVELQADCFAGVWGHYTQQAGVLEQSDLEEALNAARQLGDDAVQKRSQGHVDPASFKHGTSDQRERWLRRGFERGAISDCDTFNNPI